MSFVTVFGKLFIHFMFIQKYKNTIFKTVFEVNTVVESNKVTL